jgi:hypothetical protein
MLRDTPSMTTLAQQQARRAAAEAGRALQGLRGAAAALAQRVRGRIPVVPGAGGLAAAPPGAGSNPAAALALCLLPGAGHIYIGQRTKGAALLLLAAATAILVAPLVVLIALAIVDVRALCARLQRGRSIAPWECFWHPAADAGDTWTLERTIRHGRAEAALGDERRLIDNRSSSSKLVRTIKAAREWTHAVHLQREEATTRVQRSVLQVRDGLTRERSLEELLREQYGCSQSSKLAFEENVQVEVQAHKRLTVVLRWKDILEVGALVLRNQCGERIELPFSVVVGVTFDQAQIEE